MFGVTVEPSRPVPAVNIASRPITLRALRLPPGARHGWRTGRSVRVVRDVHSVPVTFPPQPAVPEPH